MWHDINANTYFCPIPSADSGFESEQSISPVAYDDVTTALSPTPAAAMNAVMSHHQQQQLHHSCRGQHHHQQQPQQPQHRMRHVMTSSCDNSSSKTVRGGDGMLSDDVTSGQRCARRIKEEEPTRRRRPSINALDFFRCLYSNGRCIPSPRRICGGGGDSSVWHTNARNEISILNVTDCSLLRPKR